MSKDAGTVDTNLNNPENDTFDEISNEHNVDELVTWVNIPEKFINNFNDRIAVQDEGVQLAGVEFLQNMRDNPMSICLKDAEPSQRPTMQVLWMYSVPQQTTS